MIHNHLPICIESTVNKSIENLINLYRKIFIMKQELTPRKRSFLISLSFAFILLATSELQAQVIPELIFSNPVLISGTGGHDGARYRFNNVTTGTDAVIEIRARSANNVVINNIDLTQYGWDKAFQPELGITGNVSPYQDWWVDFRMEFFDAGTDKKKKITKFVVTSLDVDGDNSSIREYIKIKKVKSAHLSSNTSLNNGLLSSNTNSNDDNETGDDRHIAGPVDNYTNIDTAATAVMATYVFENKNKIEFTIGGTTGSNYSDAGLRLNSLWFKEFDLTQPRSLPVTLMSFSTKYDKNKVILNWTTAQEKQFSHFVVQRSTDGRNFNDVSLVFTSGSSESKKDYAITDANLANMGGLVYYRLKMVDTDKDIAYSGVRIVRLGEEKGGIYITTYPNPAANDLRVTIPDAWQNKHVTLELYNSNGVKVKQVNKSNANQTEVIAIHYLGKGYYIIKASSGNETAQQKVLKN